MAIIITVITTDRTPPPATTTNSRATVASSTRRQVAHVAVLVTNLIERDGDRCVHTRVSAIVPVGTRVQVSVPARGRRFQSPTVTTAVTTTCITIRPTIHVSRRLYIPIPTTSPQRAQRRGDMTARYAHAGSCISRCALR